MKSLENFIYFATQDKNFMGFESVKMFMDSLNNVHLFHIDTSVLGNKEICEDKDFKDLEFSLPFNLCWFNFTTHALIDIPEDIDSGVLKKAIISGFGVQEVTPTYYRIVANVCLSSEKLEDGIACFPMTVSIKDGKIGMGYSPYDKLYKFLCYNLVYLVKHMVSLLQNRHFTIVENLEKINLKARIGRNLVRYKYKPKNVIYLCTEKQFKTKYPNMINSIINKPEFSWEVMGHWRKLENESSLGKNRNGEYIVEGYTWVIPHVKGQGELKRKVRVLKGENNEI